MLSSFCLFPHRIDLMQVDTCSAVSARSCERWKAAAELTANCKSIWKRRSLAASSAAASQHVERIVSEKQ
ncbi:hypothetical protein KDAU_57220 [Dictyobacter aurantiacus]|uniref:Uncharacterized protein n=1 Tax=Dictyobacter aurantiacus TaxID=1936993 RepID=A0A401ZNH1_9CHLR|nr:hypothetical protein KDAU_57220 [Dictyobacter aurantiacus]